MKSIKTIYGLEYDTSPVNSSLIRWYNNLLDKTVSDLNISDIFRMVRQDILKSVATKKAVDLFIKDPISGEYFDGELLELLVTNQELLTAEDTEKLFAALLDFNADSIEWDNTENKLKFLSNTELVKRIAQGELKNGEV